MVPRSIALIALSLGISAGCGGDDDAQVGDDAAVDADDASAETEDAGGDADPGDGWQPLIGRSWTLAGQTEDWICTVILVEDELWISGFRPQVSTGVYRQFLTVAETWDEVGDQDCTPANLGPTLLHGSGMGTGPLEFPAGVGMHVSPGKYLVLNIHAVNLDAEELTGTAGVDIKTIAASDVDDEASMVLAGQFEFTVDDGGEYKAYGGCTAPADWSIFAIWPHMHGLGTEMSIIDSVGGTDQATLMDASYSVSAQVNHEVSYVIPTNNLLKVECTYVNNTGIPVAAGDSVQTEECMAGIYRRTPTSGTIYSCMGL